MTASRRLLPFSLLAVLLSVSAVGPVFRTAEWLPATLLVAGAAVAATSLARFVQVPQPLVPITGLAGIVLMVTALFAGDVAILHLLPWHGAVEHLADLARAGSDDIAQHSAPIRPTEGVVLITASGLGVIALLVDTLAITLRQAAGAGLPLLAVYTVPAAVLPDGISWQSFALGAGGWLLLLAADARERIGRWGRPLTRNVRSTGMRSYGGRMRRGPSSLGIAARRVGATALGMAIVVPVLLPSLDDGLIETYGTGPGLIGKGGGSGEVSSLSLVANLRNDLVRRDNREVLRYRTDTGQAVRYLRVQTLDRFRGDTWVASDRPGEDTRRPLAEGLHPAISPVVKSDTRSTRFQVEDLRQRWLPLPLDATRVANLDGTWWVDDRNETVFSTSATTRNKDYVVTSLAPELKPEMLREATRAEDMSRYLELPSSGLPSVVAQEAEARTEDGATDYDKAVLLQTWLRSSAFSYSESAPVSEGDVSSIEQFLTDRKGYCVHFATTMAMMSRWLGIPARVNIGFTGGRRESDGWQVVRLHDAHAWPELYFGEYGWVSFEPTPAARTGAAPDITNPNADPSTRPTSPATPGATPSGTAGGKPADRGDGPQGPNGTGAGSDSGGAPLSRVPWGRVGIGLLVLALVLAPQTMLRLRRRWKWSAVASPVEAAEVAWSDLTDTLTDLGIRWPESETPRQTRARLVRAERLEEPTTAALARLVRTVELARYAPHSTEVSTLREDVRTVEKALTASRQVRTRLRAWLLPRAAWLLLQEIADAIRARREQLVADLAASFRGGARRRDEPAG